MEIASQDGRKLFLATSKQSILGMGKCFRRLTNHTELCRMFTFSLVLTSLHDHGPMLKMGLVQTAAKYKEIIFVASDSVAGAALCG